jgi:hypothetical protein
MPLNIAPRSTDDFIPYLKFNSKAGRWYTRNDTGEEVEVAITDLIAIFDLATIKTGWIYYVEGEAPQAIWDTNGAVAPKPTNMPKAKRGFAVNVFAPKLGGLREFSSNSNGAIIAIRALYDEQFEKAEERLTGKVPVVKCETVVPVKSKFGTNFEPRLKIIKWTERPAGLPQASPPAAIVPAKPPAVATANPDTDLDDDEIPF